MSERAGLCSRCSHSRRISSSRGSQFILCGLAASDPAFHRYPRLPVVECAGFARRDRGEEPAEEGDGSKGGHGL